VRKNKLVSIVILTYNGEKTIKDCLDSVLTQTYDNIEIIVVDNASTDETRKIVLQYGENSSLAANRFLKIKTIENEKNIGFAGRYVGIENSGGEFVLCMNQDVILDNRFVFEATKLIQSDKKIGAIQGKLLQKGPGRKIIDSTGIKIFKSRRMVDRGQGEEDNGQYEKIEEVFGCNGAVSFFRKMCLENVKLEICRGTTSATCRGRSSACAEYYDRDFFLYKEDVDLSWRVRLYGWKIIYCPKAIAYTDRTSRFVNEKDGIGQMMKTRREQKQYLRYYSFKNHHLAIIKNDLPWLFIKHLPWILPREIGAWLYVLFSEPKTWPAIIVLFRQIPQALKKRKIIMKKMKNKKVGTKEMEKWFV
jgi:GT2 family glycosyltransferase